MPIRLVAAKWKEKDRALQGVVKPSDSPATASKA